MVKAFALVLNSSRLPSGIIPMIEVPLGLATSTVSTLILFSKTPRVANSIASPREYVDPAHLMDRAGHAGGRENRSAGAATERG